MSEAADKLSTTALAKALDLPLQQLFVTLRDYGWIERRSDNWTLTPKGEYEGGSYRNSQRFGRYIVWPAALVEHPLLSAIESNQRMTAASLRRFFPGVHARSINRALAEIGLQQHSILGWELTDLGQAWGGQQAESENNGTFYVTWPHEIVDHPVVQRELSRLLPAGQLPAAAGEGAAGGVESGEDDEAIERDLFAAADAAARSALDGHQLNSNLQRQVCDWLYLAQLVHAHHRALPCEEPLYADFYLPRGNVYIDCWDSNVEGGELSARLRRRECYRELGLKALEVNEGDGERLDEVLGRGLLAFGIRC
ncbi:hypothetical protein [Parahaliea mediterranea]|uniref:hypothetical protein n=1 Tax=Parahaliea mediterranea TaxID=651086 RepID=UPI000E2FEF89|nr:hypothetical protein [Parahaliea mediterranea]